jgi:tetratricopeptide (TPR) repeat protein
MPDQDKEKAGALYREIIERAPEGDLAAWGWLGLARMEHLVPVGEDPDYDAVREAYREVVARFPDHPAGQEAFLYLQSTYVAAMDEEQTRSALEALKAFVEHRPDSGFASPCYSLMAACYEILDEPERRLQADLMAYETSEIDPTNPFQDNAWRYWILATVAEFEAGDFDTARRFYRLLIEEYPTETRKYGAEQALERMDALEARLRNEIAADGAAGS